MFFTIRKNLVIFYSLLLVIFLIVNNSSFHQLTNIIVILFLIPVWFVYKQLQLSEKNEMHFKQNINELVEKNRDLNNEIHRLEEIYDEINIVTFSYDIENEQLYISKGIEAISPFSKSELEKNPKLIKFFIASLDKNKEKELENLFSKGERGNLQLQINDNDDCIRWVALHTSPISDVNGKVERVNGYISDITDQKRLEGKLKQMAYYDKLTDLPNRNLIQKHLKKTLARSKRHEYSFAVMFIDLDGFKAINDELGHECGDLLLVEVADRLNNVVREEDLTGRLGGDEFIIVFEETTTNEVEVIAERIITSASKPYMINENEAKISPSIGISLFPQDGEDIETLIKNADKAMYFAKNNGKNSFKIYSPDLELEDGKVGKFPMFDKIMNTVSQLDLIQSVKNKF
ncbi:sensor domain-containing diguanylate cyclase [Anaerobacillus arseniciselenatis]|uniref:sensor domain-containing diguanylate cyclase n=1 Tax=Anaerobacillus arseniciselenatis TaxID=85682 RepID=UPI0009FCC5F5|nr:sensor domain-containing diguanylate cyclase [Anaerobacillus arseniciselenatis]